jgi:ABC-type sugar transport system ATPase subunit
MELDVRGLTKRFGSQTVVKDVGFKTHRGEFVALVGHSGCGKTTLLRLIAGLEKADAGEIHVAGQAIHTRLPRHRNVAMVFQGESLYPHMTVRQNLEFPLRMRSYAPDQITRRVADVAGKFEILDLLERAPATLSGGQRQRVALGRAMVREPDVCLLDEPFSHLDVHLRRQLRRELQVRKSEWNSTTIFVTHDLEEALSLGDRVAVMADGVIHQFDVPERVRNQPATPRVADFLADMS